MSSVAAALAAACTLHSVPDPLLLKASRRAEAVSCPSVAILRDELQRRGLRVGGMPVDRQIELLASTLISFPQESLRRVSDSIREAHREETAEHARWKEVASIVERAWALRIHHGPPLPLISLPGHLPRPRRTASTSSRSQRFKPY